jgi:hypothetical protein
MAARLFPATHQLLAKNHEDSLYEQLAWTHHLFCVCV